ncbi:hypothetical protein [Scopulibacillus daqui]|uniref:hypothetical protein n=1 Tax=Scopulibacillus daqui TaxID=1469162 RepID=UPI00195FF291|nr:hypothetical protein [Scopulibacillus daqui]
MKGVYKHQKPAAGHVQAINKAITHDAIIVILDTSSNSDAHWPFAAVSSYC